ncbi:hypothetical protein FYK55_03505 [Roseiconus nitratireducens]|uniref:Uncharacterized protein n=1 Tax=Roseiconus nitratireducens TaxID=2605748 RepID=A0A5M6DID3_9BACT|nr:hypothetical protein [Roseiconus nitratireducens]KAA5545990.1 hypothetical protein FYK55_03505 [Roseiconus nitratireducens]
MPKIATHNYVFVFFVALHVGSMHDCAAQDGGNSAKFASRFRRVKPLIHRRVEIGTVSKPAEAAWNRLESAADSRGELFSPREFADFLIDNQFELERQDIAHLCSLYQTLQEPPKKWTAIVESHISRGDAAVPARYEFEIAYNQYPTNLHVRSFHDGKRCTTSATRRDFGDTTAFATTATDGKHLMRFSREGYRCDQPIETAREEWNADITLFRGYHQAIRKDNPFFLYFPDTFQSCYDIEGTVTPVAELKSRVWEATETLNGKTVFFCGSPITYMTFDVHSGDLLRFSSGEYVLSNGGLRPGAADRQNSVSFASHEHFDRLGRVPTETTINVGGGITSVHLLDASRVSAATDGIVEATIPINAYVLDRVRGVKYIKHGEKGSVPKAKEN